MAFHRFVTPTYYGGMPVGYDLINVVSGGTGGGGSAFADGPKAAGNPNTGTYFVAWGEDATSSNANRGMRALSENTDHLDNLLRRDLAITMRTNNAVAASPVSSIVLPVNTFLGVAGTTNNAAGLAALFEVEDSDGKEIVDPATNTPCRVILATLGAGDQIGGGGANGAFSGNTVTLTITPAIPTGKTYRLYYGSRTNLATLPQDALTNIVIRGAAEVPAALLQYQADIASAASGDDGALLVGFHPGVSGLLSTTVSAALKELATNISNLRAETSAMIYKHPNPSATNSPTHVDTTGAIGLVTLIAFDSGLGTIDAAVDDVIEIKFMCTATTVFMNGVVFVTIKETGDPSTYGVEPVGCRARVVADTSSQICISVSHKITTPGPVLIFAFAKKATTGLGGSISLVEAQRLEAVLFRKVQS